MSRTAAPLLRRFALRLAVVAWITAPVAFRALADDDGDSDGATSGEESASGDEAGEAQGPGATTGASASPHGAGNPHGAAGNPHAGMMMAQPDPEMQQRIQEVRDAHGGRTPDHNPTGNTGRTDLTAARDRLFQVLSKRSAQVDCQETDGIADDPVADYVWIVDHVGTPPWVPARAADCLVENHAADPAFADAAARWMADPTSQAAATRLLERIDDLPEDVAVRLVTAAVTDGPDPKAARKLARQSSRPAVRQAAR